MKLPDGVTFYHEKGQGFYFYHKCYANGKYPFLFLPEGQDDYYEDVKEGLEKYK